MKNKEDKKFLILGFLMIFVLHFGLINEEILLLLIFSLLVINLYKNLKKMVKVNNFKNDYLKEFMFKSLEKMKYILKNIQKIYKKNINQSKIKIL